MFRFYLGDCVSAFNEIQLRDNLTSIRSILIDWFWPDATQNASTESSDRCHAISFNCAISHFRCCNATDLNILFHWIFRDVRRTDNQWRRDLLIYCSLSAETEKKVMFSGAKKIYHIYFAYEAIEYASNALFGQIHGNTWDEFLSIAKYANFRGPKFSNKFPIERFIRQLNDCMRQICRQIPPKKAGCSSIICKTRAVPLANVNLVKNYANSMQWHQTKIESCRKKKKWNEKSPCIFLAAFFFFSFWVCRLDEMHFVSIFVMTSARIFIIWKTVARTDAIAQCISDVILHIISFAFAYWIQKFGSIFFFGWFFLTNHHDFWWHAH